MFFDVVVGWKHPMGGGSIFFTRRKAMAKDVNPGAEWDSCPNPECKWHCKEAIPKGMRWYRKHGYYYSSQHGRITRYICLNCHQTFSDRTRMADFYLHYDHYSILEIGLAWLQGKTLKQIARDQGISIQMVRTRLKRFEPYADGRGGDWEVAESGGPDKAS